MSIAITMMTRDEKRPRDSRGQSHSEGRRQRESEEERETVAGSQSLPSSRLLLLESCKQLISVSVFT